MKKLIEEAKACRICHHDLPLGANPVFSLGISSKIIVIGQAPGTVVHRTKKPWNDKSGEELRRWLNVTSEEFYDTTKFALMPMGFCYPGKGKGGDLPPRKECAPMWHTLFMARMKQAKLILLVGSYAQQYYLKEKVKTNLTETVANFKLYQPEFFPLVHPSPRNRLWQRRNPWFEEEVIPALREAVADALQKA